jgi:hypothetical protein
VTTTAPETTAPRLKVRYVEEVRDRLKAELGLPNVMQVPRLDKIVVNMGVGAAVTQSSLLDGAVEELPHAVAPQGDLGTDRHALAELEGRDRLAGPRDHRLLAGDDAHVRDGGVEELRVLRRAADAHVDDDLLEPRDLHHVGQADGLLELRPDLVVVAPTEAGPVDRGRTQGKSFPVRRETRTLVPSPSKR